MQGVDTRERGKNDFIWFRACGREMQGGGYARARQKRFHLFRAYGRERGRGHFFRKWELFLQRSRPKEYNAQGGTTT